MGTTDSKNKEKTRKDNVQLCARVCVCMSMYIHMYKPVCFFLHTLHYFGVGVVASVCAFGACKFTAFLCIVIAVSRQREVEVEGGDCGVFSVLAGQTMARPLAHRLQLGVSLCVSLCVCAIQLGLAQCTRSIIEHSRKGKRSRLRE